MRGDGGIYLRGKIWWMHYSEYGKVIRRSTRTTNKEIAKKMLDAVRGWHPAQALPEIMARTTILAATLLKTPLVYIWWREHACLYVGASTRGLSRVCHPSHHALKNVERTDQIELVYLATAEAAFALEKKLIASLRPKYNVTNKPDAPVYLMEPIRRRRRREQHCTDTGAISSPAVLVKDM
jgi:hypothetical protein